MKVILYQFIFGYVISQVLSENTIAYHNTEQAYQYLIENQDQLILGQWIASSEHLVYLNIVFDNQNLLLQVYPRQNNEYIETHYFKLSYSLNNGSYYFDSVKNRMTWNNVQTEVMLSNNKEHNPFQCQAKLQLEIQKSQNSKNLNIYSEFEDNCQINDEKLQLLMFNDSKYSLDMQSYTALIICVSLFQIINSYYYLNSDCISNKGASLTISIILTQDIYICIFSSLLFDTPRFYYFFPCLIVQLITILYDLKLKAKLSQKENYSNKDILLLFVEMSIITFLFLKIQYWYVTIILNFFLLPQIIYTFINGSRQQFNYNYIGIIFPRVILSLYFTGHSNIEYLIIVGIILLITIVQILLYYCQCQYGLFILTNIKYNYLIKSTDYHSQLDCSICLDNLKNTSESNKIKYQEPVLIQTLNMATQKQLLMNTPCNHLFHPPCLIQWMQINLICPLCKSSLPQIC